jgi:hypothetical protein
LVACYNLLAPLLSFRYTCLLWLVYMCMAVVDQGIKRGELGSHQSV